MCGLIAHSGQVPEEDWLMTLEGAAARGPHSHGWAVWDGDRWTVDLRAGRITDHRAPRGMVRVGHSRLATSTNQHGTLPDPSEGQPLVSKDGSLMVAHNGSSVSPSLLALAGDRRPRDSWALLHLLALAEGRDVAVRLEEALEDDTPQALVWAYGPSLHFYRHAGRYRPAHPLYLTVYPTGWLLGSARVTGSALLPVGLSTLPSAQ